VYVWAHITRSLSRVSIPQLHFLLHLWNNEALKKTKNRAHFYTVAEHLFFHRALTLCK
jgi:hypothetical protein